MDTTRDARTFWDEMHGRRDPGRLGTPHPRLVAAVAGVEAGSALELGSGNGANAVWLATQGWTVTAVDVSQVALDQTAGHAEAAGVSSRIETERADLRDWEPEGTADLLCSFFLHTPLELDTAALLARAAGWVAPDGTLVIAGHSTLPPWAWDPDDADGFLSAAGIVSALGLDAPGWEVLVAEELERTARGPEGQEAEVLDAVVHAVRAPA